MALYALLEDRSGAAAIEYALLACLIAVGAIAATSDTSESLSVTFSNAGTAMTETQPQSIPGDGAPSPGTRTGIGTGNAEGQGDGGDEGNERDTGNGAAPASPFVWAPAGARITSSPPAERRTRPRNLLDSGIDSSVLGGNSTAE